MLDLLYDGGCYLTDTVGHGDPAGGAHLGVHGYGDALLVSVHTDLHLVLALAANHVTILTARNRGSSGNGETDRTFN